MWELYNGGWAAPNIYYLGHAGVINFGGARIGGLSGIYNAKHYRLVRLPSLVMEWYPREWPWQEIALSLMGLFAGDRTWQDIAHSQTRDEEEHLPLLLVTMCVFWMVICTSAEALCSDQHFPCAVGQIRTFCLGRTYQIT